MIKLCIIILINEIHWLREIHTESSTWVVCNCIKKSNAASPSDFPSQSPSDPNSLFGLSAKRSSIFPSKDLQTLIWLMVRMLCESMFMLKLNFKSGFCLCAGLKNPWTKLLFPVSYILLLLRIYSPIFSYTMFEWSLIKS